MIPHERAWTRAVKTSQLLERPAVFHHAGKQIAIFRVGSDVFAVDNRCPHEGYPLAKGTVDGRCQLTCNWHNWKFDLVSGANLYGGDKLRVYPTELRAGALWVDVSDPPPARIRGACLDNLQEAFRDHAYERMAREHIRLVDRCPLPSQLA